MTDSSKIIFRDKREERRLAEEALEAHDRSIIESALPTKAEAAAETANGVDQASEEEVAAAIARGEQEEAAANNQPKRLAARSQGIMGPILVIECPKCKAINKTIDEDSQKAWVEGKTRVFECMDPECGEVFDVTRPLQPAVQRIPRPPPSIARAIRNGSLPGLPTKGW